MKVKAHIFTVRQKDIDLGIDNPETQQSEIIFDSVDISWFRPIKDEEGNEVVHMGLNGSGREWALDVPYKIFEDAMENLPYLDFTAVNFDGFQMIEEQDEKKKIDELLDFTGDKNALN